MCLTRLFRYDGCPGGLPNAIEHFLDQEKSTIKFTKGMHQASIQIINVKVIDQNKIPFTEKENEEIDKEIEQEIKKLEAFDTESKV
jgi:hypothetical protein